MDFDRCAKTLHLARALTDRATMRLAARERYAEALADFREACSLTR
ncbi:hypothetical protein [Streptacidiphilus cavernicola]|uniref:Tetratricopeptide repeat protein n=1 Tax=Streptacidiphilus cavernicola TaxID=3342716 RepID=A0ABV6UYH8_9ACTN